MWWFWIFCFSFSSPVCVGTWMHTHLLLPAMVLAQLKCSTDLKSEKIFFFSSSAFTQAPRRMKWVGTVLLMIHFALKSSHQHLHFHFNPLPSWCTQVTGTWDSPLTRKRKKTEKEKVKGRLQLIHTHFSAFDRKYIPTNRDILKIICFLKNRRGQKYLFLVQNDRLYKLCL